MYKSDKSKILFFFSTVYPYETTLIYEFKILQNYFDKIYYFPSHIKEGEAFLPNNVFLDKNFALINKRKRIKCLVKNFFEIIKIFVGESLKDGNFFIYFRNFKYYVVNLLDNFYKVSVLKKYSLSIISSAIFYDYWFEDSVLALSILKKQGIIKKIICRAHGFDVYDERHGNLKVPFRNFKLQYIDRVSFISKDGYNYFVKKAPNFKYKYLLHYLGVLDTELLNPPLEFHNEYVIVSCSKMKDFKRVHYIPELLKHMGLRIKWVHFGSGELKEVIENKINKLPSTITCELKGEVPNYMIYDYYKKNHVDFFLSLSLSEGLPISMMEAISFGIPVAATDVGGVSEIVTNDTGILFDVNDSMEQIAIKLKQALLKNNFDRIKIKNFYKEKFDLERNLRNFIEKALLDEA
jgi:glycosyltransferase involved in cell wall biosynthesis